MKGVDAMIEEPENMTVENLKDGCAEGDTSVTVKAI